MQLAAFEYECRAKVVVGADHLAAEADVFDQLDRGGLYRAEAVGSGFEGAVIDLLGVDDPAEAVDPLDERGADAGLVEVVGGREAGDSAADDEGAFQEAKRTGLEACSTRA